MAKIKTGKYQHFKGGMYWVLGEGKHSETLELFVIYQHMEGKREIWCRPKKMFLEKVTVNGKKVQRFKFLQ